MVDITLLGTAALLPIPERALSAVTLTCNGHTILFDCGEGTQCAGRKYGVSLINVDIIALTHYHGDHVFGIPGLIQTMFSMGRTDPLYIIGPNGLEEAVEPLLKLAGWRNFEIHLMSISQEGIQLCDIIKGWPPQAHLSAFKTEHRVQSQGYTFSLNRLPKFIPEKAKSAGVPENLWKSLQRGERVQVGKRIIFPEQVLGEKRKGIKFVFSGDTALCDSLVDSAKNADLFICEGTYGENAQADLAAEHGHMTFAQAAEAALKANAKQLWLTHYSQRIKNPEDHLQDATEIFPETECGFDGKTITLKFE